MPWWSWVLIWVALGACALLVLVLGAVFIVRKGLRTMEAFGTELERVMPSSRALDPDDGGLAPSAGPAPGSAVFADPAQVRREYAEGREERRLARRDRRVQRRALRGQPQSLADLGLD
ncbi:hypothetical protein [Sinomonas halotolerans]|uniref:Uncharacterized protein n=1 Tax=Sinomonas halotolerans TaxID=1644133 RepID=A0ABU9X0Z6_9MICC